MTNKTTTATAVCDDIHCLQGLLHGKDIDMIATKGEWTHCEEGSGGIVFVWIRM